ncbi:MAG TPA: serine/threonine-protein kinase [Ktedonobacteraceae bacterium]|nr:serine/threonine-protein kinase [Ktedonobacteraceae bacterium]
MKRNNDLANYRLLREISYRGSVIIYEAEDLDLKRKVAIKALYLDEIRDRRERSSVADHFRDECYYLAQMNHQNIVKLFEYGEDNHLLYMAMEFAPFGTLARRYPPGSKLPFALVRRYARQICSALQYMHERGLLHRDVKPSNILLSNGDWALLGDLGLATREVDVPGYGKPVGTWAYMAPELAEEGPCAASDQYALATMLYEWLTGFSPFEGDGKELLRLRQHYLAPSLRPLRPDIPSPVERVVLKALEPSPIDRYASILDFADAFTAAFHPTPVRPATLSRSSYPASAGRTTRPYSARMYYTHERVMTL